MKRKLITMSNYTLVVYFIADIVKSSSRWLFKNSAEQLTNMNSFTVQYTHEIALTDIKLSVFEK